MVCISSLLQTNDVPMHGNMIGIMYPPLNCMDACVNVCVCVQIVPDKANVVVHFNLSADDGYAIIKATTWSIRDNEESCVCVCVEYR